MDYDKLPLRGKISSSGEEVKNCSCKGSCYVFYDEDRWYHVECQNCGVICELKADSLDSAIKKWNRTDRLSKRCVKCKSILVHNTGNEPICVECNYENLIAEMCVKYGIEEMCE